MLTYWRDHAVKIIKKFYNTTFFPNIVVRCGAGVARRTHNPKVAGSIPAAATCFVTRLFFTFCFGKNSGFTPGFLFSLNP